jgi:hypothetical protein
MRAASIANDGTNWLIGLRSGAVPAASLVSVLSGAAGTNDAGIGR